MVRIKNLPKSDNYIDHTSYLYKDPPELHEEQIFPHPIVHKPPKIQINELTPHERKLVDDLGFGPDDIFLMRLFKTNPSQVIRGWNLQKND